MHVDVPSPPPDDGGDVRGDGPARDDGDPEKFRNATFLNLRRGKPAGR
jgi:hypothetical protein